ncbi:MAG TPA: hypothetical protein VG895_04160 [Patescibacteria group bacterium]|nr:hypothetical protein [Patescibacteria group bacterium]
MQNSLKSVISTAKSILILLPENPSFDEVASATALYQAMTTDKDKEVNEYCPSPMIVEYNRLIGVNKIKSELGNKNLTLSFSGYNPQGIEKVSWDIDDGQFKLTIVPKVNVAPPNQDQVIVGYEGIAADYVILIGGKGDESFPVLKKEELASVALAHVGINPLTLTGKTIASLASQASSISELTANLIKASGYEITNDIATNLLMGIEETTNHFANSGVTADTFALISELMRDGGKRLNQGQVQAEDFPTGAIPTMPSDVPTSWTEPKIFKGTSVS